MREERNRASSERSPVEEVAEGGAENCSKRGGGGQPGTWPGLRDVKPKRGGKSGLGGDRAPSDVVLCKCRGRKIEGVERDPNSCPEGALI